MKWQVAGCDKMALGKSGVCSGCKAKANHRASVELPEPQVIDAVKQHAVNEAAGELTGDAAGRGPTGQITAQLSEAAAVQNSMLHEMIRKMKVRIPSNPGSFCWLATFSP